MTVYMRVLLSINGFYDDLGKSLDQAIPGIQ